MEIRVQLFAIKVLGNCTMYVYWEELYRKSGFWSFDIAYDVGWCHSLCTWRLVKLKGLPLWWKFAKMVQAKVETWALSPLQFSTLVELESGKVVCVSVRPQFSRVTALRIFPKLGQKLRGDEWGTVTRPFFPWKIKLINYSWKQVLAIFSSFGPRLDLILHIVIGLSVSNDLGMVRGHA